jgi:hypothetical protein
LLLGSLAAREFVRCGLGVGGPPSCVRMGTNIFSQNPLDWKQWRVIVQNDGGNRGRAISLR